MIEFKKAERAGTHLLLGIAGPSGSGKTLSALRLARGMASDDSRIFVIDTEAGRALHYACAPGEKPGKFTFNFQHGELGPPFSPMAYGDALKAAVDAGAEVVIIDSASHEHEGPGGILEMHVKEHQRLGGRDATKFAAWIEPKRLHGIYVNSLLQTKAHLIFCFRAKDKMAMVKNEKGRMEPTSIGWTAICPDRMEYEMADLLMLLPGANGIPDLSLGKVYEHHRSIFEGDSNIQRQLSEEHGRKLVAWAGGASSDDDSDDDLESEARSQDLFDYFSEKLDRDLDHDQLDALGVEIARDVDDLSPEHYKKIRETFAARKEALK